MTDPKYRLETFGGLSARVVGPWTPVLAGQRKRLALLASLAAHAGAAVTRDRLLALLWPESDLDRARNALKQLVHAIRRELGEAAIVDTNGALTLDAGIVSCDVQEFRSAVVHGQFAHAAELYRGPFLDGVYLRDVPEFERWVETTRRSLELQYSSALEQLAACATRSGDTAAALRWSRTLAALDPLNTRAALLLIEALAAGGDLSGAIRHGEMHALLLRHELDVGAPRELHEALEKLRATPASVAPTAQGSASTDASPVGDARRMASDGDSPPLHPRRSRRVLVAGSLTLAVLALLVVTLQLRGPRYTAARSGTLVPLTHGQAVETNPSVSPDGKWLAFAAAPPGDTRAQFNSRIYVRRIDGGPAVPITPDSIGMEVEPRWSPDGARIAFRARTGIYVVTALGGTPQLLIPAVSDNPGFASWLGLGDWSHDGRRIAYADTAGIWIRDLARGTSRLVTRTLGFGAHSPTWSPDDAYLAYSIGTGGAANVAPSSIWLVPAAGGRAAQLTDGNHMNTSPQFASDGRSIFYVSNRDGARDIYQQRLPRHGDERIAPTRLTTGAQAMSISMSANGRHLVYGAEIMRSNVWTAPIMPAGPTPASAIRAVTDGMQEVEGLSVSRDDKWLLYDSNRSGNQDIYKVPINGGEPIQLTDEPADDFCPSLSPDGGEIAFYSFRGSGDRRVFTMLAGGERQMPALDVPSNEQEWCPTWSPDGRALIFDAATTGARHVSVIFRLADSRWGGRRDLYGFAVEGGRWSPDGKYILAISRDSGLVLLSPDGRLVRVIARRSSAGTLVNAVWGSSPDTAYYRTSSPRQESAFWAVSITGGAPRLLLRLDDSMHASRRAEFATDGTRLFFTISTDDANIWMLDLLQ